MKLINCFLGFFFLFLGAIGIILPLLPTTPFLLLASYFFIKSSKKLSNWLITHKLFGHYLDNYLKYKAVSNKTKFFAIIILWSSITASALIINHILIYIILDIVAISVSIHILKLKNIKKNKSG